MFWTLSWNYNVNFNINNMKQTNSKYHLLYLKIKEIKEYEFDNDIKKLLLELVKEVYEDAKPHLGVTDYNGKYGIEYRTIHDDSRFSENHRIFFKTKEDRDNILISWKKGEYWDNIFNQELELPTPVPNVHDFKKIFREGDEIYTEK